MVGRVFGSFLGRVLSPGSLSPSSVDWSRTEKSSPWRRSTSSLSQSRSTRSSTFSSPPSRTRSWLSSPSRSRPLPVNEPDSRLSLPSVTLTGRSGRLLRGMPTDIRHVGLGVKCAKEVATAIRGAIIVAKLSIVPVRRGYWGSHIAEPHTVPAKVAGKSGSVMCRLIPAPRGTGIVAAPASKRMLQMAGIQDCYTQSKGSTATQGTVAALAKTYQFQSPDLWQIIPPGLSASRCCLLSRNSTDDSHTTSTPTTFSSLPERPPLTKRRESSGKGYEDFISLRCIDIATISLGILLT